MMRAHAIRAIGLMLVGAGGLGACAGSAAGAAPESDAAITYLDGFADTNGDVDEDGAVGDAPVPRSCALVSVVASETKGCRADWTCAAAGLYTFVCAPSQAGSSTCFCIVADEPRATGSVNGCTGGEAGVQLAAASFCGWPFAALPGGADGGLD